MRRLACALACLIAVTACSSSSSDPAAGEPSTELSVTVGRFGHAYLEGDMKAVLGLIEPSEAKKVDGSNGTLKFFQSSEGAITLKNFSYKIVNKTEDSAKANYGGQRCAPKTTSEFGEPDSTVVSIVLGKTECFEIDVQYGFTKVDGLWYAVLAGP